jgi:ABC-type Zn uptake system ZnuABC Zn-binding protein ZnuA
MILILASVAALAAAALTACGDEEPGAETAVFAASTGILADLAEQVSGPDAEVVQVIPDTTSPHDFQPSAADRQDLVEADLRIANGAGLDTSLTADDGAPVWALAEEIPDPLPFADEEHTDEEHTNEDADEEHVEDEHGHVGEVDPHVWMDPTRVAAALPSLAAAMGEADPAHAEAYHRRARELAGELEVLDAEMERDLHSVPAPDRVLVTSHDALSYFAERYGFEVVATVFPATGADAEASASALAGVIDAVEEAGVGALFAEETDDAEALDAVAAETGALVVPDLLVESPGSAGSYEEMLRRDAELIADALKR